MDFKELQEFVSSQWAVIVVVVVIMTPIVVLIVRFLYANRLEELKAKLELMQIAAGEGSTTITGKSPTRNSTGSRVPVGGEYRTQPPSRGRPDTSTGVVYLKRVFITWTIEGSLDHWVLSSFHSLLNLTGNPRPIDSMRDWVEDARVTASNATELPLSNFAYLEIDFPKDFDALAVEDSFFRLWKRAVSKRDPSAMAAIRLAAQAYLGEERERQCIADWNRNL